MKMIKKLKSEEKSEKISGIYIIFGYDNTVYIGESADILNRSTVQFAKQLKLDWEIIKCLPNSTKKVRLYEEGRAISRFQNEGFIVVNNNNGWGFMEL